LDRFPFVPLPRGLESVSSLRELIF
jgi:hypothetical protein